VAIGAYVSTCKRKQQIIIGMNKVIVVTGGTKGIGRAIIRTFAGQGFSVVTCARTQAGLEALKRETEADFPGTQVFIQPADLSSKSDVLNFAAFVKKLQRPVEVLVNNGGHFLPGQIHTEAEGTLESMIETHVYSAYHLTRQLVPDMMARRSGHIFTMCSTASIMAYTNGGSYCMAKFALYGMTKVLRAEMREHGVRVTAILPGATLTASWEGVDLPPDRFMKPEDVAESVYAAYALSRNSVVEEILIRPQLGDLP
jgi:short-subunit dehydrogenase